MCNISTRLTNIQYTSVLLILIHSGYSFFKKKKSFQNNLAGFHQNVNQLEPHQARNFVGPDLGPNCLQRFSADNKNLI